MRHSTAPRFEEMQVNGLNPKLIDALYCSLFRDEV